MSETTELMTKQVEFSVNGESVKLTGKTVKNFLVRGNSDVTDQEAAMFINLCKYQKLNPFLNEAYLVKFKGSPAQMIVGKEAFMKRAENNEQFQGFKAGIIVEREGDMVELEGAIKLPKDNLIGGWADVYRADRQQPICVRISLDEFSKGQSTWKTMPLNMIRKTAIVNALREAFPNSLGNLYTEEEEQANDDIPAEERVRREVNENANTEVIDIEPIPDPQTEQPEPQPTKKDEKPSVFEGNGPDF
ncbi:phage recombination protein Bet [Bacillus velezensis]|uniref:phage recombination protein Bet n=1 Tax=Bacillus TaxID=1386 RepID=UPI00083E52AA|nr:MULTISPECIES: phage recombination protein Bet [Bacillus]AWM42721.1 phage recombination protein Bet [Bacillus amyloliquefaciens]MCE4941396.1 phage recombination protein Bet [Bacillus velezensis]MCX2854249.1 phage recombination protein Bet [Bacillus sp. KeR2]MDU0078114.1 phage recombination protein Bet [Bacillus sp. IG2]MDU0103824.1 phage recombination protein Bet [Bacillus sp. IS1]